MMESLKEIVERQQRESPTYYDDPEKDRMMATILALTEEICVLRDRLDTCGRLADAGQAATLDNIEAYAVSDALRDERLQAATQLFERTFAGLQAD